MFGQYLMQLNVSRVFWIINCISRLASSFQVTENVDPNKIFVANYQARSFPDDVSLQSSPGCVPCVLFAKISIGCANFLTAGVPLFN